MTGWPSSSWCFDMCRRGDESQQATRPQVRQRRRCTQSRAPSARSEERRVGKECRFRWKPEHSKKNIRNHTESYGIIRNHTESYGIIQKHKESYGIILNHT